ncbi:MAG: hypothetical protein NTU69_10100 [Proteobacteria bacterium]|jgi:hypothetical protein|nr:hypothetical protein [Pseudomonadota bacterium]
MKEQMHKRFMDEQVSMILDRYLSKEILIEQAMDLLGLKRRQFFEWVKRYRQSLGEFTVGYKREGVSRKICKEVEDNIIRELASEKQLIDDKTMPVWSYNYSYIRDQIRKKYAQEVSLTTIISRAKKNGFYIPKREKKIHDREISTHYVGELNTD